VYKLLDTKTLQTISEIRSGNRWSMIRFASTFFAVSLVLGVFAALCASEPAIAGNIEYTITDLGVLPNAPSNGGSYATAMSSAGEVVGYGDIYTDYSHAFLYTGSGPLINLGSFGGDYSVSSATSINASGTVVGYSGPTGPGTLAFVYTQSGGMQNLGTLGGPTSSAASINDSGQIVGSADTASGNSDGFIYSGNGPMVDLGSTYTPFLINDSGLVVATAGSAATSESTYISTGGTGAWVNIGSLGGTRTQPYGINNSGAVVGFSTTGASDTDHAFLYSNGTMTNLGTLGGDTSGASGINDYGIVVGSSSLPGDIGSDAFIYYGSGSIIDLNSLVDPSLGWTIGDAVAINDRGKIAADGYQPDGTYHAILLTPVPEPTSVIQLLVAGFVILAARSRVSFGWTAKRGDAGANHKSYD
jgi:probable HAF family extracellular repeat protein